VAEAPAPEPENTPDIVTNPEQELAPGKVRVARIQLLTDGAAPWSMFVVSALTTIAIAIFFLRHGLLWHRFLLRGERFIVRHRFLDITLVAVGVLGFVLTRAAGSIY
jgi:hypothetical protein